MRWVWLAMVWTLMLAWAQPVGEYLEGTILSIEEGSASVQVGSQTLQADLPSESQLRVGQAVVIYRADGRAFVTEPARMGYLYTLLALFVLAVVVLGRGKGVRGLLGTLASLLVLIYAVIPLMIAGWNPLLVTFVGAFLILMLSIYFVHGVNRKTTAALAGTSFSTLLALGLASLFSQWMGFTGLFSEETFLARSTIANLDLLSLYLAGVVVGALGALNDVTVTQASVVQALAQANPRYNVRELYRRAMEVGFDHIGSLVNTLILAYSAGSLPLMLLVYQSEVPLRYLLNGEPFAAELVSMLVGSLGLVLAVPFTTLLAAWLFHGSGGRQVAQRMPTASRTWVQDLLDEEPPR